MAGHLFVTEGDLTRLASDAWLLPTDVTGRVNPVWAKCDPDLESSIAALRCNEALRTRERVAPLRPGDDQGPAIWAIDTGGTGSEDAEWYADAVEAGIRAAVAGLDRTARHGRDRPLVGVPLVGLGEGMGEPIAGEIVAAQVDRIVHLSGRLRRKVDIAVVALGADKLAAAQQARRRAYERLKASPWAELTGAEVSEAERLAALARQGDLVLFVGSGVSSAAGLPGWDQLLGTLAKKAGLTRSNDLRDLNPLDQARLIRRSLGGGRFEAEMEEIFAGKREQGLPHQLLTSLPIREVATTNYDTLFEDAWRFGGRKVAVLPRKRALTERRWLVKLHGSIKKPSSIVLTRDDYLRMDREGSALAGIVQALLITRRMLFVGYSLDDDRFHQIAHDARAAIGSADERPDSEPFGVALSLVGRQSVRKLWEGDIDVLDLSGGGDKSAGARRIEIFLDCLVATSDNPAAYLNNPGFQALWTETEKELAVALDQVRSLVGRRDSGPAAAAVARQLRPLLTPEDPG